jgi:hypothetical protein
LKLNLNDKISSPKPATNNSSAEVPVSVSFLSVLVSPVVFGKNNTNAVELSSIAAGTGGFIIYGENHDDASGYSVSSAGTKIFKLIAIDNKATRARDYI